MKQMKSDIRLPFWCDNHGAIAIANDEVGLTRDNKWMDLDYFHFRDFQREGKIAIGYVDTNLNPADFFTKKLGSTKCDSYLDIISGNGSTNPGADKPLPAMLKKLMFSPPLLADHVADRVHQGPQERMPTIASQDKS